MRKRAVARRGAGVGVVALLVAGASLAFGATVQKKPAPSWQTNGRVNAIAIVGDTAYIGGKFTSVRPAGDPLGTGEVTRNHVAAFNLQTGALLSWDPSGVPTPSNCLSVCALSQGPSASPRCLLRRTCYT